MSIQHFHEYCLIAYQNVLPIWSPLDSSKNAFLCNFINNIFKIFYIFAKNDTSLHSCACYLLFVGLKIIVLHLLNLFYKSGGTIEPPVSQSPCSLSAGLMTAPLAGVQERWPSVYLADGSVNVSCCYGQNCLNSYVDSLNPSVTISGEGL